MSEEKRLPQQPSYVNDDLLRAAGVPGDQVEKVMRLELVCLLVAIVEQAGGRVVLPLDWFERASALTPGPRGRAIAACHTEDGYVVEVVSIDEALPDPRRN